MIERILMLHGMAVRSADNRKQRHQQNKQRCQKGAVAATANLLEMLHSLFKHLLSGMICQLQKLTRPLLVRTICRTRAC